MLLENMLKDSAKALKVNESMSFENDLADVVSFVENGDYCLFI